MRAKDFFDFFSTIPFTVMDPNPIPEKIRVMKWRVVNDLRHVIPGDIICYRPKGSAAGGAAFTINDRRDILSLLTAVRMAQLWQEIRETGALVTKNIARDERVRPWVRSLKDKLALIDIFTVKDLYKNIRSINKRLRKIGKPCIRQRTLEMMKECCQTRVTNTGHIVFASGPMQYVGDNEFRVRVVHSTKYGKKDADGNVTTGVQEYYRRFNLVEEDDGTSYWTRQKRTKPVIKQVVEKSHISDETDDEDENPNDDMDEERSPDYIEEEEPDDSSMSNPNSGEETTDQGETVGVPLVTTTVQSKDDVLAAVRVANVEVIAARMCF